MAIGLACRAVLRCASVGGFADNTIDVAGRDRLQLNNAGAHDPGESGGRGDKQADAMASSR